MAETERPNPFGAVFMDGKWWTTAQVGDGPPVLAEVIAPGKMEEDLIVHTVNWQALYR